MDNQNQFPLGNSNDQYFMQDSISKRRKMLDSLIRTDKYCLPFIFVFKESSALSDYKGDQVAKYEGTLCYENGYPICLRRWKFFALNYNKSLSKFYYICRQSNQLKFCLKFQQPHQLGLSNQEILEKIEVKLQQNLDILYQFLIKLGLVKQKQKSFNRLRCIYAVGAVRREMNEVLDLHSTAFDHNQQSINQNFRKNKKQPETRKQKQFYGSSISQQTNQTMTQASSPSSSPIHTPNFHHNMYLSAAKSRKCCAKQFKSNKQDFQQSRQIDSAVIKVNKIKILSPDKNIKPQQNSGGYFSVRKFYASLTLKTEPMNSQMQNEGQESVLKTQQQIQYDAKLAVKGLKNQFQGSSKYLQKVQHEINILRQIKNNQYICKYFEFQKERQSQDKNTQKEEIYMESLALSLKQILSKDLFCNYFQIIKQIFASICCLHESGIVHRDIKPGNIMFNQNGQLKLIDFSESIECWRKLEKDMNKNANVGFTLPYSPLECSFLSSDGYSNLKIDNWSVGMTIIQLLLGSLPVRYSKCMGSSIKSGWPSQQFHWCLNLRRNCSTDELLLPLKFMSQKLMKFQPKNRLCLESVYNYIRNFERLFF